MTSKARSVAVWITVVGVTIFMLTAAAFHRTILEAWHLNRLRSEDPEVVADAAARLGALGSVKGLAALLRMPGDGGAAWQELIGTYRTDALEERSAAVLDEVTAAFDETDPLVHERAVILLERLGPGAHTGILPLLRHSSGLAGELRLRVIKFLSGLVIATPELLDDVIDALQGRDDDVQLTIQYVIHFAAEEAPEILPRLLDALRDPSVVVRVKIAETLGSLGEHAERAVPVLVRSLRDPSHEVRCAAARALGGVGEAVRDAVPDLISALADQNATVRSNAALTLAVTARTDPGTMGQLISALEADVVLIRSGAACALGLVGEAAAALAPGSLAKTCRDPAEDVRCAAITSLGKLGVYTPAVVSALLTALDDPSAQVRRTAIVNLTESREDPDVLVPAFVARLEDTALGVREAASQALKSIAAEDASRVILVATDLRAQPEAVRQGIIFALAESGSAAEQVIVEALSDPSPSIRLFAVQSLGSSDANVPELLSHLLVPLNDPVVEVREMASHALATVATRSADTALPIVVAQLGAKSERVRAGIALGLAYMGPGARDAVPALTARLTDVSSEVREKAALALGEIGEIDTDALPALLSLLQDNVAGVPESAMTALAKLARGDAERGLPAVLEGMEHDSAAVRSGVLHALSHVPGDDRVRATFFAALDDPSQDVRLTAAGLLGDFEPLLAGSIQRLVGALEDKSWRVRSVAASSLGRSAGAAREAVPALLRRLEDPDPDVRDVVVTALVYIVREVPEAHRELEMARESDSSAVRRGVEKVLAQISNEQ